MKLRSNANEANRDKGDRKASALINTNMSMRRLILITEHFRLMNLLVENREAAISARFLPLLTAYVPKMPYQDKAAVNRAHPGSLDKLLHPDPSDPDNTNVLKTREEFAQHVLNMIWTADPSPKKAYTTWMLTRYVSPKDEADKLALEDLQRTSGYLALYDRVKNKLPPELRDINRIRSTDALFHAIKNYRENEKGEIITQDFEERMYGEAKVLLDDANYEILIPETKEASIYFGRGTEWCTAYAPPKDHNQFDTYNRVGPLYIIRDKTTGDRWQFHLDYTPPQYRDEADRMIDIHQFVRQHPEVSEFFDHYFGAEEWEEVATFDEGRLAAYFHAEGDGYVLRVAKPGSTFGGLIREEPYFSATTDKDRHIVRVSGKCVGTPGYEQGLLDVMTALKFKGNHPELADHDVIYTKGKGWGSIEQYPTLLSETYGDTRFDAHKVEFTRGHFNIYMSEFGPRGADDLAAFFCDGRSFHMKSYQSAGRWDDDRDDFLGKVLLKGMPEAMTFDREQSAMKLPAELLAKSRPQWVDTKSLWLATGDTTEVRNRIADWVCLHNTYLPHNKVEWVGNRMIVDLHKNVTALIDAEGNNILKAIIHDKYDFHSNSEAADRDTKDNMLERLAKNEPTLFKRLLAHLRDEFELEIEDAGIDLDDADGIMELIDEVGDVGLDDAFDGAYSDAISTGCENEAHEAMWEALRNPYILYHKDGKWTPDPQHDAEVAILGTIEQIIDCANDPDDLDASDINEGGHGQFLKTFEEPLELDEPRYGWSGYDRTVEKDRFTELVREFVGDED